jgi:hypothetical protein
MMIWMVLGLLALVGFVAYPRLMFGLLGALARGTLSIIVDSLALLFAWI